MDGECRLCGRHRKLHQSHIIPEGAYRPIYDEESRAIAIHSKNAKRRKIQQGLKERLLCDVCENILIRLKSHLLSFGVTQIFSPNVSDKTKCM